MGDKDNWLSKLFLELHISFNLELDENEFKSVQTCLGLTVQLLITKKKGKEKKEWCPKVWGTTFCISTVMHYI